MFSAALAYFDAVNSVLALILITIGAKIFLGAADIQAKFDPRLGFARPRAVGKACRGDRALSQNTRGRRDACPPCCGGRCQCGFLWVC